MKHIIDDADKNKYEALSKAEVIALLQQVIESGELPEGELNGLVLAIRNPIDNNDYRIAFCTQAKYNELKAAGELIENCLYFITDDSTLEDLDTKYTNMINEQILQVYRPPITSIECRLHFSGFTESEDISLINHYGTTQYQRQVNILPLGAVKSIASATVQYVSGDNGIIYYVLKAIGQYDNYIEFEARCSKSISYISTSYETIERHTTFRLAVTDIYGNSFTKDFTLDYWTNP